jgi:mannose/fructose/sorbose-specific phosphotransferase system IID component
MEKTFNKKELNQVFWRSLALQGCFNYERMQAIGFAYAMVPILRKLYGNDPEKMAEALKRHVGFFNTSPQLVSFIYGTTIALEEQNSKSEDFDTASINSLKAALMGPLAGIGDSFFWGTFRIIGAGIGASLAIQGNILGAFMLILIYNIPHYLLRYHGLHIGYSQGMVFLQSAFASGTIEKLTQAAKIMGAVVVGALIASLVRISTPFVLTVGETSVQLQSVFDNIMPKILPLGLTFLLFYFIKKGTKTTHIMFALILFAIVGVFLGIL